MQELRGRTTITHFKRDPKKPSKNSLAVSVRCGDCPKISIAGGEWLSLRCVERPAHDTIPIREMIFPCVEAADEEDLGENHSDSAREDEDEYGEDDNPDIPPPYGHLHIPAESDDEAGRGGIERASGLSGRGSHDTELVVRVSGYLRQSGTYVEPHLRGAADSSESEAGDVDFF